MKSNFFSIIVFCIILFSSCHSNMKHIAPNTLDIQGKKVEKSYYQPEKATITHGVFELENKGDILLKGSIHSLHCLIGEDSIPISEFFIYQLPDYQEYESATIEIEANESLTIEVSFAQIPAYEHLKKEVSIIAVFQFGNDFFQAESDYSFDIRRARD